MASILNEFKTFDIISEDLKQKIKLFNVVGGVFGIFVTNNDKVYLCGPSSYKFSIETIPNTFVLIDELCDKNIEQFFCFGYIVFARSNDNKIYEIFWKYLRQLLIGNEWEDCQKPKKINIESQTIVDITCNNLGQCLALTTQGLVYGWGDNKSNQFKDFSKRSLIPSLINSVSEVEKRVKHIQFYNNTAVLVSFDGFVYTLNQYELIFMYKIPNLTNVYKIYKELVLKNTGVIELISYKEVIFRSSYENLINSHYFAEELIVETEEGIHTINVKSGEVSQFNNKNAFDFCLFRYQSTFTTIYLKENNIYWQRFDLDQDTKSLFKSTEKIDFDIEEYRNKYYNTNIPISLKKLQIFKSLPELMESKVKLYHQITEIHLPDYSAIIVMYDNKVYGIGYNIHGKLGLGHTRRENEYTLIEELCDKYIEEFFEGEYCMFARNNQNEIFNWGVNTGGIFTLGTKFLKPYKYDFLDNKNIIEISFGCNHCLALSEDGTLYGWGSNSYGQIGYSNDYNKEYTPNQLILEFENVSLDKRIKYINCFAYTSCAVTVDGRAYLWGEVDGQKTVKLKFIDFNVSKAFILSYSMVSILTNDKKFKFKSNNKEICKSEEVIDIFENIYQKEDAVYEVNRFTDEIGRTDFSNIYEYLKYKYNRIETTIEITNEGYLMRPTLHLNEESSNQKLKLTKVFENIFDKKFENSFENLQSLGFGAFGEVFKVKTKANNMLFAIKRMQIKG